MGRIRVVEMLIHHGGRDGLKHDLPPDDTRMTAAGARAFRPEEDEVLGTILTGGWRVVRRLGRSPNSLAFEVVDTEPARPPRDSGEAYVAPSRKPVQCVKFLPPGMGEAAIRRAERQFAGLRQVCHRNVLRLGEFVLDRSIDPDGVAYVQMDHLGGWSLRDLIAGELAADPRVEGSRTWKTPGAPLRIEDVALVGTQIAQGVHALHDAGHLHLSLRPEHVMVQYGLVEGELPPAYARVHALGGRTTVISLVRLETAGDSVSPASSPNPTLIDSSPRVSSRDLMYMAPEQATHSSACDVNADIYALGVVLYECLTGRLPFTGTTTEELADARTSDPAPAVAVHRPSHDTPIELERLISHKLAKDPRDRPGTMLAVSGVLRKFMPKPRRLGTAIP